MNEEGTEKHLKKYGPKLSILKENYKLTGPRNLASPNHKKGEVNYTNSPSNKASNKETILKAIRKYRCVTYRWAKIRISRFLTGNNAREKTELSLNTERKGKKTSCLRTLYSVKIFFQK